MEAVFFPRKDYDVEICAHRYGKKMTYTDQSDQLKFAGNREWSAQLEGGKSYNWITTLAKRYGVKVGFFAYYAEPTQPDFDIALSDLNAGYIWIDQYSYAPEIKDKITRHNPISPEEFRRAYYNSLLPPFYEKVGKKPVALSYSYGEQSFSDATCPLYLAGRNSGGYTYGDTDYGKGYGSPLDVPYSMEGYKSKASSYRWFDSAKTMINGGTEEANAYQTAINNVATYIDATKQNGGWFSNFTHFHDIMTKSELSRIYAEKYYEMLSDKNTDGDIYFAGYGEAVAYLVFRQMVVRAVMYSPIAASQKLVIQLETRNSMGIDEELLQVPLSIKFSTQSTPLQGKKIKSSRNLISLGNNNYIVEIPFSRFPDAVIERA